MERTAAVQIVDFGVATPEVTQDRPNAERLLTGDPVTTAKNFFSDAEHGFHAGIWQSTVGSWRVTYNEHEFATSRLGECAFVMKCGAGNSEPDNRSSFPLASQASGKC